MQAQLGSPGESGVGLGRMQDVENQAPVHHHVRFLHDAGRREVGEGKRENKGERGREKKGKRGRGKRYGKKQHVDSILLVFNKVMIHII